MGFRVCNKQGNYYTNHGGSYRLLERLGLSLTAENQQMTSSGMDAMLSCR